MSAEEDAVTTNDKKGSKDSKSSSDSQDAAASGNLQAASGQSQYSLGASPASTSKTQILMKYVNAGSPKPNTGLTSNPASLNSAPSGSLNGNNNNNGYGSVNTSLNTIGTNNSIFSGALNQTNLSAYDPNTSMASNLTGANNNGQETDSKQDALINSQSHSFVGNLPQFPNHPRAVGGNQGTFTTALSGRAQVGTGGYLPGSSGGSGGGGGGRMPRNRSEPAISKIQNEKLIGGTHMTAKQLPKSLSYDALSYARDPIVNELIDMPQFASVGLGNDMKQKIQEALQIAIRKQTLQQQKQQQLQQQQKQSMVSSSLVGGAAYGGSSGDVNIIPPAPDAIPPDAVPDSSGRGGGVIPIGQAELDEPQHVALKKSTEIGTDSPRAVLARPGSIEDLQTLVNQGWNVYLFYCVMHGIVGPFLFGYNTSALNVPQANIACSLPYNNKKYTDLCAEDYATREEDSEYGDLTAVMEMLTTIFVIGQLVGSLMGGKFSSTFGRKGALLISDVIYIISGVLMFFFAKDYYAAFAGGRALSGFAGGMALAIAPSYLGEISPALIRGSVGTCNQVMLTVGILVTSIVGYSGILGGYDKLLGYDRWLYILLFNAIPSAIQICLFMTFPESPKWLLQKDREEDAIAALQKLRMNPNVKMDIYLLKAALAGDKAKEESFSKKKKRKQSGGGGVMYEQLKSDPDKPDIIVNEANLDLLQKPHLEPPNRSDNVKVSKKQVPRRQKAQKKGFREMISSLTRSKSKSKRGMINPEQSVSINNPSGSDGAPLLGGGGIITNQQTGIIVHQNQHSHSISLTAEEEDSDTHKKRRAVYWAFIISIFVMALQQFSGINTIFFYSSETLANAGLTDELPQWLGTCGIALANIIGVLMAVALVDKLGRQKLLIISAIGMIVFSILVSFCLMNSGDQIWGYTAIGSLAMIAVTFEWGLGPIPWTLAAEVAPSSHLAIITSVATAVNAGCSMAIASFSNDVVSTAYYFPFIVVLIISIFIIYFYVPETKGKKETEIQQELQEKPLCFGL